RHIIAVLPFLWNRRQDPIMTEDDKEKWSRKIAKPDEIQRLRKIIHLLSVCGVNELLVATPHSNKMAKYCEDYDIKFHEIDPSMQFANTIQTYIPSENMSIARIYAPDAGSIPRAVNIARILRCPVIFNLKNREYNRETSIVKDKEEILENLSKEFREYYHFEELYHITPELVTDKIMIMIEDEVASGGTANETARMLQKCEVKSIFLLATHAVLTLGWRNKLFYLNPFKKIIMTNTITRGYDKRTGGSIFDITLAPQFASYLFKILKRL
ncbi:MAG TPA: phosphoribosyltransferase family protein, partial [Candidatus Paceibacterota bacterium]|nr:phosphoribosyltransferase family protein [Candidatus Paceibacterota bacterium]